MRKLLFRIVGVGIVAFVVLLIAVGFVVEQSAQDVELLRAELAERAPSRAPRPEAERSEIIELARATRLPPAAPALPAPHPPPADAATAPAAPPSAPRVADPPPPDLMDPAYDALFGRDPAERPIHEWLRAIRLTRTQPGPAPPPDVLAALARVAPELDALALRLSSAEVGDETAPFVAPGDMASRSQLQHARVLLLAAACAESLASPGGGDLLRGERLLDAAWTLSRGLPPGIDDAGPGDLVLAVMRQVRVADARAWDARLEQLAPQARLIDTLEWDAAERLARWERAAARRRQVQPGWMPAAVQLFLGDIETRHDRLFMSRIAAAELTLAEQARALDACADPWTLQSLSEGAMKRHWPVAGEVRLRVALASASLAQSDTALTRHVLLRRHGFDAPRDGCGAADLIERPVEGHRFVVGWRVAGSDEPGPGDREVMRNHAPNFRTWPEPSLPGPPLDPFTFEAPPGA